MKFANLSRAVMSIFTPPFRGLATVIWIYFAWSFLAHPHSPILMGELPDTDDYTILTHTLDWLKGQSWFDIAQHRLNPPEGTTLHFSRFTELPLAALILPLHLIGLSWTGAATIAAAIWPLIVLIGFFAAIRWTAKNFLPPDWTRATAFVALFMLPVMNLYVPGRVDHHGLVALLTLMAFGCTLRMIKEPEILKWGLYAGLFLGLGQIIALEILPWLILLAGWIGLWMIKEGPVAARSGLFFGLTLYLASAIGLMVTRRPDTWITPDVLAYSATYVLLAGEIAICCAGVALAAQYLPIKPRAWIGVSLALAGAAFFFLLFPDMSTGPYGAMHKELAKVMFDNIVEMQPAAAVPQNLPATLLMLTGFLACIGVMPKRKEKEFPSWLLLFLMLGSAFLLASFYQIRFAKYAVLLGIIPITVWLKRSLAWAKMRFRGRKLAAIELGLLLLAGPLQAVLLPATIDGRPFNTGVLLFPVTYNKESCDNGILENVLKNPLAYGNKPRIIMNTINEGPSILFRTPHKVLAAPYHTNVSGTLDAVRFFTGTDPAEARQLLRKRNADLVVLCKPLSVVYKGNHAEKASQAAKRPEDLKPGATLAEQLVAEKIPSWLKPVKLKNTDNILLFAVKP